MSSAETRDEHGGSGLARDGIDAVELKHRSVCIAGKPAPTGYVLLTHPMPAGSWSQRYHVI
ncbi:hypothetical protein [Pseudomonas fragi]|uniref:Uncharacterized protein n=1 Tax=Pseudomonas fragi TaxID=296 RepID=A0A9Q5FPT3_PSEFR|nr:hypothetical protein [Pseudomonas fragi]NNB16448.1 hypothetical protein [Pseudomonas fragi]NNB21311.1 hypothetical protein [Pseudomonas fragi]NNB25340.1 hypothetical protein [Pseudomonas fragi]NNB49329.1 hypothetical protein [Pseudomonas fragi]